MSWIPYRGKEVGAMRNMESFSEGQGLVEYALIMLFVAIAIIVVLAVLGPYIGNMYSQVVPNI